MTAPLPTFDDLASRYQSRRVARDVLEGRKVDSQHWWWWDASLALDRLEIERAAQAAQQGDAKDPLFRQFP